MKVLIVLTIVFSLSVEVLAESAPTGGKACETFNSFYGKELGDIFAKYRDFTSTDAEFASSLARGGLEADQVKQYVIVRNNCRLHVEAIEEQYENKSASSDDNSHEDTRSNDWTSNNSDLDSNNLGVNKEGWKILNNWRKLTTNMGYDDVRKILGEPDRINGGSVARWYYKNGGEATFISNKLDSWKEPKK